MKTICIYHSVDLDGWMSAAIVKHFLFEQAVENKSGFKSYNSIEETDFNIRNVYTFLGYNYGDPIPDLSKYDKVIMCDISFPKDYMRILRRELFDFSNGRDNLIWIDHHVSAIKDSEIEFYNNCEGVRDTKFAACELTWQYFFHNETIPEIVRLLGRYDCFGHKGTDEETKVLEFQYGARQCISNYEEAYTELLYSLQNYPIKSEIPIHENGKAIYKYLCTEAKQIYKNGFELNFLYFKNDINKEDHVKFITINRERFNPINFEIDYHKEGYDGVACFWYSGQTKLWHFSLYNDNGLVDCSVIAKQFGGGGHKGASGFTVQDLTQIL